MASIPVNFVILVSLIALFLYLLGVHNLVTRVENNACEMTYMFEYPQYVELSLSSDIQKRHPRYSLYGYSEGSGTGELRKMKFSGVPVLYIPGSGGSHRQGRSLASIALRKALNSRTPFHFDFFLVDFNEDLSGIYGGVLVDQTEFVISCINKILDLYRKDHNQEPTSVVLIGHSAGGLIAKGVFTDPHFDPKTVRLIITLASPHAAPLVQPDPYFPDYYNRLAKVFGDRSGNASHVTLVSLGGGERDVIVRSDLIKDPDADVNVLTTGVPGVWCSMDHLSITWCKQLILTLVRTLFDCVDLQTKQITHDRSYRKDVFEYHLIRRSAGKKFGPHPIRAGFERNGKWIENLLRQFSVVEKKNTKIPQFLMLRLINDPKHAAAILETVNLNVKDWVYACVADVIVNDVRVCDEGVNLSNLTEIIPAKKSRRKMVRLNMLALKDRGFTHVVVRIPPASSFMQVNVDIHQPLDRIINYPVPRITSLSTGVIIESTADNAVHYRVNLLGFDQIWQAFGVHLEAVTCRAASNHAIITFSVSWANETKHFYLVDEKETSVSLKLTSPPPKESQNETASLELVLDPSCKYRLSLGPDKIGVAAQFARYYTVLLPGYLVAVIIMTLRRQLECLDSGTGVPFFHNALAESVRKYYILLQAVIIGSKVIGSKMLSPVFPTPDPLILQEANMDFFFLHIGLFSVATALAYISGAVIYAAIVVSGQTAHKLAFRFLARTVTGFASWSEWVFSALHQLPIVAAAILISLSTATTGGLALSLAAAFYYLKLCKLYEDYLEELFKLSIKFVATTIKSVTRGRTETKISETEVGDSSDGLAGEESEKSDQKREKLEEEVSDEIDNNAAAVLSPELDNSEIVPVVEDTHQDPPELTTLQEIHFHVTLCLLYVVTAATTVPSILAWSRSFHESAQLLKDPTWWPGIIYCAAGAIVWQGGVPKPNVRLARISTSFLFLVAVLCIMYASVSLYLLSFISSSALIYLLVHQVSARFI